MNAQVSNTESSNWKSVGVMKLSELKEESFDIQAEILRRRSMASVVAVPTTIH